VEKKTAMGARARLLAAVGAAERQQNAMVTRHMSERAALRQTHEAYTTGVRPASALAKQPKGLIGFLQRITGIQAFKEASYRRDDARREQFAQAAIRGPWSPPRPARRKQEISRRAEALKAQEDARGTAPPK